MLYLVGLGLGDAKDITVRGLEIVKRAARVYLEAYTSILTVGKDELVLFFTLALESSYCLDPGGVLRARVDSSRQGNGGAELGSSTGRCRQGRCCISRSWRSSEVVCLFAINTYTECQFLPVPPLMQTSYLELPNAPFPIRSQLIHILPSKFAKFPSKFTIKLCCILCTKGGSQCLHTDGCRVLRSAAVQFR